MLKLTLSQTAAFEKLKNSKDNLFLTGGAGTGKSSLIKEYLSHFPASRKQMPVLASTGAAAILMGGRTFHSFFGLGIMQGGPQAVLEKARQNKRLIKRLKDAETIIIDEVSMLSAKVLDCAEKIARAARASEAAWGGLRVIAVGDFFQLPPVSRSGRDRDWAFKGNAWEDSCFQVAELTEVVRTEDEEFLKFLHLVRYGLVNDEVREFLDARVREEGDVDITHLFSRRDRTEIFNQQRLAEIDTETYSIPTRYEGDPRGVEALAREAPIPPVLDLKTGAFVMIRVNDPKQRFVNGTTGYVRKIYNDSVLIESDQGRWEVEPFNFSYLDAEGKEIAHAINFPLSLAYASTIHKIQGATLGKVHIDLGQIWEPGQAYVALSRVRKGSDFSLMRWSESSILTDSQVRAFYDRDVQKKRIVGANRIWEKPF